MPGKGDLSDWARGRGAGPTAVIGVTEVVALHLRDSCIGAMPGVHYRAGVGLSVTVLCAPSYVISSALQPP